jgi:hypothetical protein
MDRTDIILEPKIQADFDTATDRIYLNIEKGMIGPRKKLMICSTQGVIDMRIINLAEERG